MDKKILYIDVETTGLDCLKHEIIQLAGIIVVNGRAEEEFNYHIKPLHLDLSDISLAVALEKSGTTMGDLSTYTLPSDIYEELVGVLGKHVNKYNRNDKYYLAGYNIGFDLGFIKEFFKNNDDKYLGSWLNWKKIDVLGLLHYLDYCGKLSLSNYRLETACKYFGIGIVAHDAMSDIRATMELLSILQREYFTSCPGNSYVELW